MCIRDSTRWSRSAAQGLLEGLSSWSSWVLTDWLIGWQSFCCSCSVFLRNDTFMIVVTKMHWAWTDSASAVVEAISLADSCSPEGKEKGSCHHIKSSVLSMLHKVTSVNSHISADALSSLMQQIVLSCWRVNQMLPLHSLTADFVYCVVSISFACFLSQQPLHCLSVSLQSKLL